MPGIHALWGQREKFQCWGVWEPKWQAPLAKLVPVPGGFHSCHSKTGTGHGDREA